MPQQYFIYRMCSIKIRSIKTRFSMFPFPSCCELTSTVYFLNLVGWRRTRTTELRMINTIFYCKRTTSPIQPSENNLVQPQKAIRYIIKYEIKRTITALQLNPQLQLYIVGGVTRTSTIEGNWKEWTKTEVESHTFWRSFSWGTILPKHFRRSRDSSGDIDAESHGRNTAIIFTGILHRNCQTKDACSSRENFSMSRGNTWQHHIPGMIKRKSKTQNKNRKMRY